MLSVVVPIILYTRVSVETATLTHSLFIYPQSGEPDAGRLWISFDTLSNKEEITTKNEWATHFILLELERILPGDSGQDKKSSVTRMRWRRRMNEPRTPFTWSWRVLRLETLDLESRFSSVSRVSTACCGLWSPLSSRHRIFYSNSSTNYIRGLPN